MSKKALIFWGGWDGHEPAKVASVFDRMLSGMGFVTKVTDTLETLGDKDLVAGMDLIVPCWTMGKISKEQLESVTSSVKNGAGIAGVHGGMCDAFREATEWQFMTGGQWVAHPGNDGTKYRVNIAAPENPLVKGIADFDVSSEQYYMHVDPAVKVLATTRFPVAEGLHTPNGPVDMPVAWTKLYGAGRVYYCSLGHHADIVEMPQVMELMRRGFSWAAR